MARRRYTVDQIISKLREAEVELGKGLKVPRVCEQLGIARATNPSYARLEEVDQEMVQAFEKHAARRRMTPSYEMNLRMLDHHLDEIVPKDADPKLFNEHGHLMNRELKEWQERLQVEPERPRVLGYLELQL